MFHLDSIHSYRTHTTIQPYSLSRKDLPSMMLQQQYHTACC